MGNQLDIKTLESLVEKGLISTETLKSLTGGEHEENTNNGEFPHITVGEILESYNKFLKHNNLSSNTIDGYFSNLKSFIKFAYNVEDAESASDKVLVPIRKTDVEKWLHGLISEGYTGRSALRFKHSIKKFIDFLNVKYGVKPEDVDSINIDAENNTDVEDLNILTYDEVYEMADYVSDNRTKAIILLMFEASMKRQEIIDCKKSDIDFDKNFISIRKSSDGTIDRIGRFSDKTKKILIDFMNEWESEIEQTNRARLEKSEKLKTKYTPIINSEYLFQTIRSPQISYGTINRLVNQTFMEYYINKYSENGYDKDKAEEMAKNKSSMLSTETFRHSLRTYLLAEGKDLQTVQAIMGDENKHSVRRYLKIAQKIYPEKFFN